MKKSMSPSGGKREGAGRKQLYGEETVPVVTKVPASKVEDFKRLVKEKILKKWELNKKKS
jgi:hypothetical protein